MKSLKLCLFILGLCLSVSLGNFDITISDVFYNDSLELNDQSLLIEGAGVRYVHSYGDSYIEIQDTTNYQWQVGGVENINLHDQSTANISGGEILGLSTWDSSSMSIYNGKIDYLMITDNSSATLYGGDFKAIRNSQFVPVGSEINLHIFCKDWKWNDSTNYLTVTWADNSSVDIELRDTQWDDLSEYKMIDHITFTIIPEPVTIVLFGLGCLLIRTRKS